MPLPLPAGALPAAVTSSLLGLSSSSLLPSPASWPICLYLSWLPAAVLKPLGGLQSNWLEKGATVRQWVVPATSEESVRID